MQCLPGRWFHQISQSVQGTWWNCCIWLCLPAWTSITFQQPQAWRKVIILSNALCILLCNNACTYILHRLSYSVVTLDKLIERYSSKSQLFLLYDVACSLQKYLQVIIIILHTNWNKYGNCYRIMGEVIFYLEWNWQYLFSMLMGINQNVRYY